MASANRRSSSLTDVATLHHKFRSYGFTADEMQKQSYMLTPFDLSECVGLQNSTYPKQPLGPLYPSGSLFDSGCRSSIRGHDRKQSSPRKVQSETVTLANQKLSGKSASNKRTRLPHAGFIGNSECLKSKVNSTEELPKQNKSRIPVPIATTKPTLQASRSATELKTGHVKLTVVKRHFSSPNLDENIPSKIPVRIIKEHKNGSITKSYGDAVKSSRSITNTSTEDGLSGIKQQSPPISPRPSSIETKKQPVIDNSFGSGPIKKWASGSLELPVGDKKGDDVQSTGSADLDKKDHQAVPTTFLNHKSPGEANKPQSVTSSRLPHQEELHGATVSKEGELCWSKASYHQSSILLLTCETDCTSESGADTDKEERTNIKLPQTEEDTIMKSELISQDSVNSKPELVVERDSGIALSRLALVDNQSSLLVMSHDTDCTSDGGSDDDLLHVSSRDGGPQNLEREVSFVLTTTSDTDRGCEEGLLQEQSDTREETQVVSSVQMDNHSEDQRPEMETGNYSLEISSTTRTEISLTKQKEQCSDTEAEFLHMACVFNACTDLSPVRSKEHVIRKEKTRCLHKRPKQQSIHKVPDGFPQQHSGYKWVSETLSSSEEEDPESRHKGETIEGVDKLGSCEKTQVVSSVQMDNHSEDKRPEMETGNDSLHISSTTRTETSLTKEEEQCSNTEAEFLHMACVFNACTDLSPVRSKEHVIRKEKTRRRYKRPMQQSIHKVPDGFPPQRSRHKWVSETLSSSEEENPESSGETIQGVVKLGSCKKENILLRGQSERLKQTNSTLRSDTRSLLTKLENEADKNELLNGKSSRLRTQVRSLKREMKGTKTKSRQREKALKADIDKLDKRLASADKLTSRLDSRLQQKVKLFHEDITKYELQIKLRQLEEMVAAQRVELQRADKLVELEKAKLRRANELIDEQKAELRVADEETVNQLGQLQCTFAVLKQQELALKETKELSETRRERVAKLKEQITVVLQKLPQIEEKLLTERSNSFGLREQVVVLNNQLQASRGLEQQTAESNKALDLKNRQLLDENERLRQELEALKLQSKYDSFAQAELGSVVEQKMSEGSLPNEVDSANINANERNASEFLWLMSECSQLKELVRKFESEHHSLVQRTDAEKETMRREIHRLMEEGFRKDKELDMMESSLEELGKIKNHEIMSLKQALGRLQQSSSRLKEELRRKEEEVRMMTVTKPNNKWFRGRQQ